MCVIVCAYVATRIQGSFPLHWFPSLFLRSVLTESEDDQLARLASGVTDLCISASLVLGLQVHNAAAHSFYTDAEDPHPSPHARSSSFIHCAIFPGLGGWF